MERYLKSCKKWLCISIAMMLISMICVSVIQTSGGTIEIKQLTVETDEGWQMDCDLYIPDTATVYTKAPAVVTSHGNYNNKEMQDANCIELARRGFVVLNVDQPNHGNSEAKEGEDFTVIFSAIYQGALVVSRLPYVDDSRIGVTGHSAGAYSSNYAMLSEKDHETHLISAVLLNCADAIYVDDNKEFSNDYYGARSVGIVSAQYDEFMHYGYANATDTTPATFAPAFMESDNAQSFLHFGKDPSGLEKRESDTVYKESIDGVECIRVIYRPDIIHPWSHFSVKATADVVDFFDEAFFSPTEIESSNQIWMFKELFNFIGLIGVVIFIVSFAVLMTNVPCFKSLQQSEPAERLVVENRKGKAWFWGLLFANAIFSTVIFLPVITATIQVNVRQTETFAIGCWAALCGLFNILCMVVYYRMYGKSNGLNLAERGVTLPLKKLGQTIGLACIVVGAAYLWVFFADFFFKADFRLWVLAMKTFTADKVVLSVKPYLWLFLIYYIAISISANSFNYNDIGSKKCKIGNGVIVAFFTVFPALILPWTQYGYYYATDKLLFWGVNPARLQMYVLWLFPMVLILPAAIFVSRKIYKATKNPYIAGIILAIIVTIISCTNSRDFIL